MTRTPHDADTPSAAAQATPIVESGRDFEKARAKAEKAMRLASALRANLRRRKAPARTPAAPRDSN
ncbi:hypothetical protein [uncultured Brevundimonas sp.]|uniref:hypothetical protein n=1 Tax=uncultured Brevundimonas sp. TaxID=213418 RepID=UPI0025E3D808|nr:hypothetical protein [uncultured Brevundimonas sp.]